MGSRATMEIQWSTLKGTQEGDFERDEELILTDQIVRWNGREKMLKEPSWEGTWAEDWRPGKLKSERKYVWLGQKRGWSVWQDQITKHVLQGYAGAQGENTEACLGDLQGLRSEKGGRRAVGIISRSLVGVATVAHVIRLTCQGWVPMVHVAGGQRLIQSCPACLWPTDCCSVRTQAVRIGSSCKQTPERSCFQRPGWLHPWLPGNSRTSCKVPSQEIKRML